MNLCIDCVHVSADDAGFVCKRTRRVSPVDGAVRHYSCSVERGFNTADGCGNTGQHFVARPVPLHAAEAAGGLAE